MQLLLKVPTMTPVGIQMANTYLEKVGHAISPHEVLQIHGEIGITLNDFNKLYKKFKGGIKQVGRGLRLGRLPNPRQLLRLRKLVHNKCEDLVGNPLFVNNTYEVRCNNESLKLKYKILQLDNFNNVLLDV